MLKKDWYRHRAAEMFGVPYEDVTEAQRRLAKDRFWLTAYMSPTTSIQGMLQDQQEAAQILKETDFAAMELRLVALLGWSPTSVSRK